MRISGSGGTVDQLQVRVFASEAELGQATARNTAEIIRSTVNAKGKARVLAATGNSQFSFTAALQDEPEVPWDAVTLFHLDEYVGLDTDHPASFRRWIRERLVEPLRPREVHYITGDAPDPQAECQRYEELLRAEPLDLVCMGIGENGHIAFNEPDRTDFADPAWVRIIELDEKSRKQQVGEGHFPTIDDVPAHAISLTVPALLAPAAIQVAVPEARKAEAVRATLTDPISPACPATILREQSHAILFCDQDSAALMLAT